MGNSLAIYWSDRKVGRLWLTEGGDFIFQYDSEWVASSEALPISLRLPVQKEPFESAVARPFFSNLLPEGPMRDLVAKRLGISEKNDFMLLEKLGGECAGALCLLPEGKIPDQTGDYEPVSDEDLDKMIEEMPRKPLLTAKGGLRLSLAGAQHKLPVYIKEGSIFLPRGTYSSSHILKPEIPGFEDTVMNEAFCMMLARECGLPVPKVEIWGRKHRVFLVQRYDRTSISGPVLRLHQEDFCQALGYRYDQKYESEGGPGLKECFDLLEKQSMEPILDKRNLLRWVIFNTLIGNCDAHAKNISLLITQDGARLAPFYDLMSTKVYSGLSDELAMKIGGENRPDWVMKRHWERLAEEAGVGFRAILGFCQDLEETLPAAAKRLEKTFASQHGASKILQKIIRDSDKRASLLSERLTEKVSHRPSPPSEDSAAKYAPEIRAANGFLHDSVTNQFARFGGWELQVRPIDYDAARLPDPRDVRRLIRKSEVNLRGWNVLHTDKGENSSYFLNGWQSLTEWPGHAFEGYRAYQSGLIVWKAVFKEDLMARKDQPGDRILSFVNVIWQVTEIFLFVKKYYEVLPSVKGVQMQLTLHGTAKRRLASFKFDVSIREDLIAQEPQIILEEEIKIDDLEGSWKAIANRWIRRIFLLFGEEEISETVVSGWQKKLLNGEF